MIWISAVVAADGEETRNLGLQLIHIPGVDNTRPDGMADAPFRRQLDIPLNLGLVHHMDFCDETGTLAVVTIHSSRPSNQTLHLFKY